MGSDAEVQTSWHTKRKENPAMFKSRFGNKV